MNDTIVDISASSTTGKVQETNNTKTQDTQTGLQTQPVPARIATQRRAWRRLLPLLVLVASIWWLLRIVYEPPGALSLVGLDAPLLRTETFAGVPLDLATLRDKGVLLNFWASWCGPCQAEAALLADAWSVQNAPGGQDVVFVGIAHMDTVAESLRFLETYAITYPNAPDPTGQWAKAYGVYGIPETFFIDPAGIVRDHVRGPLLNATDLQSRLDQIRPLATP